MDSLRTATDDDAPVAVFDLAWNGSVALSAVLQVAGLALCTLEVLSPLDTTYARPWFLGYIVLVSLFSIYGFNRLVREDLFVTGLPQAATLLLLPVFGVPALVFAAGTLALPDPERPRGRPRRLLDLFWLKALFQGVVLVGAAGVGTIIWLLQAHNLVETWAVQHGAKLGSGLAQRNGFFEGNVSYNWWLWVAFVIVALTMVVLVALSSLWWDNTVATTRLIDSVDQTRRLRAAEDLRSLVHDGVLSVTERAAAGQPLSLIERTQLTSMNLWIRRYILQDATPRTTARFIDSIRAMCAERGVELREPLAVAVVDPPAHILRVFEKAVGALIANLGHAGVDDVTMIVLADADSMHVTLRDEGSGFDPATAQWSPHTERQVFSALAALEPPGEAVPHSAVGKGTTWTLSWPASN